MNPNFWQKKKVFITGHTGFKGSWLSLWLQSMGADVFGFALNPPTNPSLFDVANVADGMSSIIGDVRDYDCLFEALNNSQAEIVFHMAAQPLVRLSYLQPTETYATNVMGTVNLLEAVRQVKCVRSVVIVTSDKCYENHELDHPFVESDAMGGHDPYSSSKGCAELVTSAYRSSYFSPTTYANHGVAVASVRAGNVIGGGDWALDRLIPDFMRSIVGGRPVCIRSPDAVRPWQHVLEPLSGYLILAQGLFERGAIFSSAWNFGPRKTDLKSVKWIIDKIACAWGPDAQWVLDNDIHPHEAHMLMLDSSKAHKELGWTPVWSLERALLNIVEWYKDYAKMSDMRLKCLDEIRVYVQETKV